MQWFTTVKLFVTSGLKVNKRLIEILAFCSFIVLSSFGNLQAESLDKSANSVKKERPHPRKNTYMKRKWGVEVLFVRHAAAGYMLEFRYKVLDPVKAKDLFERQTKPIMSHLRTGAKMIVPTPAKTGALRNSNPPLIDHTYWMYFANPGKLVKKGDLVNIAIGDFLVENIIVK
ncbi:MAG: hypothetical protein COA86_10810 [Kangiella sp.]|nr:MAG: hypothetical protein COA86_10810 [Kangiella sp.]